jgi:hypoxanthine phosphoribosyltransferase
MSKEVPPGGERLHDAATVQAAYEDMARRINRDYAGRRPLVLAVLIGGLLPAGRLVPLLDVPLQLDYIHATRYRGGTRGHDDLHWKAKPVASLQDRDVLLIDDILDQGVTLQALVRYCQAQGAASVASAVLVRKLRDDAVTGADYIGLDVPDRYVFGCGMDYGEYHRQFPAIYALPEDH